MDAAVSAAKLGISLGDVAGTAESLLDFESSIEKQMQAEILLGRSLNLDYARRLAYAGDFPELQKELVRLVGSEAEWNELNYVKRIAMADALHMNVEKVNSIIGAQQRLNQTSSLMEGTLSNIGAGFVAMAPVIMGIIGGLVGAIPAIRAAFTYGASAKVEALAIAKGMGLALAGVGAGTAIGVGIQKAYEVEDATVEDGQLVSYGEGQMLKALPNDDVAIAPNLFDTMAENKQVTQQIVNAELDTSKIESLLGNLIKSSDGNLTENKKVVAENKILREQNLFLFGKLGRTIEGQKLA